LFSEIERHAGFGCPASYNCSSECECSEKSIHLALLDKQKHARSISVTTHLKPIICWFRDRLYEEAHQDGARPGDQHE
jgi:hypothetical protein